MEKDFPALILSEGNFRFTISGVKLVVGFDFDAGEIIRFPSVEG
jgi:hypothetical protein